MVKLREIDAVLSQLEALATLRGEAQEGFERVMETVEVDCRWIDRAVGDLSSSAGGDGAAGPQRRDFERQIALTLRARLNDRTKAMQQCAALRQKTLKDQRRRRDKFARLSGSGRAAAAKVRLDTPLFNATLKPLATSSQRTADRADKATGDRSGDGATDGTTDGPTDGPTDGTTDGTPTPPRSNGAGGSSTFGNGLRSRRPQQPTVWDPTSVTNSRLQLQEHQKQQQQMLLLEQASRRRLEHAQTIESEIGKLGDMFSRFSTLIAEQAEVVVRLDDDLEVARVEVDAGYDALTDAQRLIKGNRSLIIKVFALIIVFTFIFVRY